jgi:hypothetical protein
MVSDGAVRPIRTVSWNVANRVGDAARRQGEFLASLSPQPDLVMFQEVNRRSIETVSERAGLGWFFLAADLRMPQPGDTPVRQRGVALAGCGPPPVGLGIIDDAPLPERTIYGVVRIHGRPVTIASYHAPPGVNWQEKKPAQAVLFARWLATVPGPVVFGADANTPLLDHPDFELVRTHWQTGAGKLNGLPGDDLLWGPTKVHGLEDALRRWLSCNPTEFAQMRMERPLGPLATSHRTGKRRTCDGTDRRFDSVWVSEEFQADAVSYPYDASLRAGSDHSAVIADLSLESSST